MRRKREGVRFQPHLSGRAIIENEMERSVKSFSTVSADRLLLLPPHLREKLQTSTVYIAIDPLERSLHVYTQQEWNEVVKYLKSLPTNYEEMRLFVRKIIASVHKTRLDMDGYLFIPESFERHTGIAGKTEVVIVDHISNIEIMTVNEWDILMDPSS